MNEQLEFTRAEFLRLEDEYEAREAYQSLHFPKLKALALEIKAKAREDRIKLLLEQKQDTFIELVDLLIRARQLTNSDRIRDLCDQYEGGWIGG